MNKDNSKKEQYKANRTALIQISAGLRVLVKSGAIDSVNEGLKEIYEKSDSNIEEFRTFWQWKDDGYTIQKGAKAFLIWGQPRKGSQIAEGSEEPEEFKYWPLCYLFANTQVFKPGHNKQDPEQPQNQTAAPIFDESLI
ncbi:MAG: hypothetical protein ACOYMF_05535 [Bacteroidales bacterium]